MRHPISLRLLTITLVALGPVDRLEAAGPSTSPAPAVSNPQMTATLMRLPLQFEANQGQVDEQVKFLARGTGYRLFLTPSESVLVLQQRERATEPAQRERGEPTAMRELATIKQAVVRMTLEGANPTPAMEGKEPLPGIVNYFIGNDPAKWRTNIPTYAKVQYHEAYPGIDLAYYGNQGTVEYDFIVSPGADPDRSGWPSKGHRRFTSPTAAISSSRPHWATCGSRSRSSINWIRMGTRPLIAGHYVLQPRARVGLASRPPSTVVGIHLAAYDRSKPVVIDPVLLYSTYLGGSGVEEGRSIAVDGASQVYVTGWTTSTDFPTATPIQAALVDRNDAFVAKISAAGTALLYSTYLGGSDSEMGNGIAVDGSGQAYVTGLTFGNFPTLNASQSAFGGGGDAFVTKLSALVTNQPPLCGAAQANPAVLWAPNHQFVPITIMGVTDPDEDAVTITATGVTQDEPVNGKGDGNTSPDAVIQARAASVRAERAGNGDGRVYHIAFTADDGHGNSCSGVVTVGVPHSQKKGMTAIDDGQLYNSTMP